MTLTRLIGDIHGRWYEYQIITDSISHNSIQVGDFGIGFAESYWHDRVNDYHATGQHRFIRGNHDSPEMCRTEMVGWIPDGTIEDNIMFVGGAWSIDWRHRTPGKSWWNDEQLSEKQFSHILSMYEAVKPDVMITHDFPTLASYHMFFKNNKVGNTLHLTRTGEAFQRMLEIHQPKLWVAGHWHIDTDTVIDNTRFICLGELGYVDVDLDTLEVTKPYNFGVW